MALRSRPVSPLSARSIPSSDAMSASDNVAIEIEGTEVAQVPESARSVVFPLADGVPEEAYPPYLLKTQLGK